MGYVQHTNPQLNTSTPQLNTSPAIEYWMNELSNRTQSTRDLYLDGFNKFLAYVNKTADELLRQREEDQTNRDKKIQRRIETQLKQFLADEEAQECSASTQQLHYAAIRSFFETHYTPLIMKKGDYPEGESIGVRRATKEAIIKALENGQSRHKALTDALTMFAKDSGLRESDIQRLNYGDIARHLESGANLIPITIITKKTKLVAKTFIGEEAIQTLKIYLDARRTGTRNIPPETITDTSPLFAKWTPEGLGERLPRTTIANTIRNAFLRVNEPNMSAHSLRKYLQTALEEANVNTNWIDQMLGHKLINSRDAYSKPTDEQLREAYAKAYKNVKVYPHIETAQETPQTEPSNTATAMSLDQLVKLLAEGYQMKLYKTEEAEA